MERETLTPRTQKVTTLLRNRKNANARSKKVNPQLKGMSNLPSRTRLSHGLSLSVSPLQFRGLIGIGRGLWSRRGDWFCIEWGGAIEARSANIFGRHVGNPGSTSPWWTWNPVVPFGYHFVDSSETRERLIEAMGEIHRPRRQWLLYPPSSNAGITRWLSESHYNKRVHLD